MESNTDDTVYSEKEWNNIAENEMSPSNVVQYFYEKMKIRSFHELLKHFYNGQDVKERLIQKLCEYDRDTKSDSIRRKVSNWVNGRNEPANREEWIKICFALNLSEMEARQFMCFSLDGGFHLRNSKELAYLYCLRVKKDYIQAVEFVSALKQPDIWQQSNPQMVYTKVISDAFINIYDDTAFHQFYLDNYDKFGCLHNTAYERFICFFDQLRCPDTPLYMEKETEYSIEQAVDTYLRMNLPFDKNTSKFNAVQKAVRSFWPNATTIKNMRNRKEDVNRKVILLLYVITEGIGSSEESLDFLFEDMTSQELLEEHAWKINLMLYDCGMGRLDPRNPFDWLILYSLKTNDDEKGMGQRLQEVLEILFPA